MTQETIHAYRHLHRTLLRAVQHASPARYIARNQLREAFRDPQARLDPEGVKRTLWFLEAAAKERGLEHRILKNLIEVRGKREAARLDWRKVLNRNKQPNPWTDYQKAAFDQYDMTVAMLNKTMGLCLR